MAPCSAGCTESPESRKMQLCDIRPSYWFNVAPFKPAQPPRATSAAHDWPGPFLQGNNRPRTATEPDHSPVPQQICCDAIHRPCRLYHKKTAVRLSKGAKERLLAVLLALVCHLQENFKDQENCRASAVRDSPPNAGHPI